jgi:hypothetical protein
MSMRDRMPTILAILNESLPKGKANASDSTKDINGSSTSVLKNALRDIGVAEFVINGDVGSFRRHLSESAKLQLSLFERSVLGEPISTSYAYSVLAYKEVFDALAACDMATAEALARHMGRRPDWEDKHDHPFDRAMGRTLKAFVLGLRDEMVTQLDGFSERCKKREDADFSGYATVFRALLEQDAALAQEGLSALVKGHQKQIKRGGVFHGSMDEVICVWGVGMANLTRWRGLPLEAAPPFLPAELLCD